MVIDKVNGQDIPRYLAYDIIKFEGQDVGKTDFYPVRLGCIDVSGGLKSFTLINVVILLNIDVPN